MFEEIFQRIKDATNTRTQVELAEVLDIRQSSISDAKKRSSVPSDWYMKLFEKYGLNPDWIKKGTGPRYLRTIDGDYTPFDEPETGMLYENRARYALPDTAGVVVTVHGRECVGSDEEGWTPTEIGRLNVPHAYAREEIVVHKVESSSMEPYIRRNAYVGLDSAQNNVIAGELYGVYIPFEGLALKRVFLDMESNRFVLRAENSSHPDQYMDVDKYQSRIVGRLVWVLQDM